MREEATVVWSQLNAHEINEEDEDTYCFRQYDDVWDDDEWFMSFRLELIME